MNTAVFAGRVGADAELKYTQGGKAVADFNIAVDNGKDSEGQKRQPTWIKAVLWEKRAESLAQYIKKGSMVIVQGPVSAEAWVSKQDSKPTARITVNVREFTFGGGARNEEQNSAPAPRSEPADPRNSGPITDDDIPF